MKIYNNKFVTSFNGYKNVLSYDAKPTDGCSRECFFALELNDSDGYNDLEYYKSLLDISPEIQKSNSPTPPVLSCLCHIGGKKDYFYLNSFYLYNLDDFKVSEKTLGEIPYKRYETFMLRAYTLLASLTKRMSHIDLCEKDKGFMNVINFSCKTIADLIGNQKMAQKVVMDYCMANQKFNFMAYDINKRIQRTMTKYILR